MKEAEDPDESGHSKTPGEIRNCELKFADGGPGSGSLLSCMPGREVHSIAR